MHDTSTAIGTESWSKEDNSVFSSSPQSFNHRSVPVSASLTVLHLYDSYGNSVQVGLLEFCLVHHS